MSTTIEELELEIESNSKGAVDGIDALISSLNKLKQATKGLGLSPVAKDIGKITNATNQMGSSNTKASKSFTDLYHKLRTYAKGFKIVGEAIFSAIKKSNDYTENMNLFSVSMGEYAGEAMRYAETVSDTMGIDTSEWIRAQGVFMTMATGFGVASDRAAIMSKNLTQLGYDLSSFYNIDTETAMLKLKSGLAGELEPLRAIGYDLSQAKLEATALELGIDKAVSSMTQAEKAQLRYYAIMTQVTSAHGDMARTLDDPANQIRVLKAEFNMAAREIGNVFIPALNAILPYAIAGVKVIRTLASTIASLVGYEMPEVDYSGVSAIGNTATETSDAMENAKESAKKLKSYMLGFDELNVINPNEGTSGAEDVLGGFGFELPEYDFLEGLAESKVATIVEDMKEWLGITEDIDSWADLFETKLGKILIAVGLVGAGFALWKISSAFVTAFSTISSLFGVKGIGNIGKSGGASGITSPKTILKGLANVALIIGGVVVLVTALGLLTKIPGLNETINDGLSALKDVFVGLLPVLIPIGLVSAGMVTVGNVKVSQVSKGLANTAIIIGGTTALITAIGALVSIPYFSDFLSTGITSMIDMFNGLYDIAIPIGLLSGAILALGFATPTTVASGLAGFAIIIGGTTALVTAIGALMTIPYFNDFLSTGISSLQDTFNGLYDIALPIGVLSGLLIALGIATPATILSGLAGFALVVGGFELLLVALGALKQIPGFTWIVDEGAEVLAQLGNTLGKFAGSIVGGFSEGISASFPQIGKDLADFMKNAKPFFEGLENVNSESVKAVGDLATMVLTLTATDILDGLTEWFTGGNSLVKFGEDLNAFAPNFVAYANAVKDIDGSAVEASSIAALSICEFANNIPNEGGKLAWFAGDNNIDVFGKKLPAFGKSFKEYSDSIKGLDTSVVDNTTAAAKSLVALCKEIPNSGGVASWFTGDNDIADFGEKLAKFGKKFKEYYDTIKGISISTINNVTNCIGNIVDFAIRIKNGVSIGMVEDFTDAIVDMGKAIKNLPSSKTITITVEQINKSTEIDSIWDAIGNLPLFTDGGFPEQGQMFIAREAGTEMVGNIGRRTAVANNDQIVSGIAGGVAEANEEQNALLREQNSLLRAILEKDSGVYLDGKNLTNSVEKYQRERGRVLITGGVL